MNTEIVLTNARVVTCDAEFDGTVVVRDGLIADVITGRSHVPGAIDLDGDYLMPGVIIMSRPIPMKRFAPNVGMILHSTWMLASAKYLL